MGKGYVPQTENTRDVAIRLEFGHTDIDFWCVVGLTMEEIAKLRANDVKDVVKQFGVNSRYFQPIDIPRSTVRNAFRGFVGSTSIQLFVGADYDEVSISISRSFLDQQCRFR
jgi:hypothetical protein